MFTPLNPTRAPAKAGTSDPAAFRLEGNPELLSRFRAGECDALACVYQRYSPELLRSIRMGFTLQGARYVRLAGLRDEATSQDAVHDAFVRAFADAARLRYDGVRPYGAFLARIARNVRIDHARQRHREVPLGDMDGHEAVGMPVSWTLARHSPFDDESFEPEEALDWARRRRATLGYLAELVPELRQFVHLRYVEELSQAEVARAMAITRRRVRTLEQRLLGGLRRWLHRKSLEPWGRRTGTPGRPSRARPGALHRRQGSVEVGHQVVDVLEPY